MSMLDETLVERVDNLLEPLLQEQTSAAGERRTADIGGYSEDILDLVLEGGAPDDFFEE